MRGVLIPEFEISLLEKKAFLGIGFGASIPIDILPIYFLSKIHSDFTLLVVDEFLKINGATQSGMETARTNFLTTLGHLNQVYDAKPNVLLCSDFMNSQEYKEIFQELKQKVFSDKTLEELAIKTVPENKRFIASAKEYPVHEYACVEYMATQGYQLKFGPSQEVVYDRVMQMLNFDVEFTYILDAFALGTKTPDKVVHYISTSRGPNGGQRLYLGDGERIVNAKLQQGCDEALRYFCKIASVAGLLLGKDSLDEEQINSLYKKKLKKKTKNLVMENIVRPYQEVN
ncbi:hypothetical protein HN695_02200 [Candidatus Woesearchaeota archaeon]|jgi:hypothetical protein|nr:hypothetical protein [Candidatus Woesearchaeota archaeon]MBT5272897.1 hypothetical protein [Candidatus Woesearchaeota archaeon]MBT6041363.1 hypothetical protein [Candidatus Woesearchaeota archaeon]MBT6337246.1 hypothetical protein [Candidatus Woesearchaeota archaeon]MBT7927123.1 hypothetical protein [Candidatus Woesearchaeota archaeon]